MFFAENFARAANLHVLHGEEKAGAEFFHLLNGFQTALGLRGQCVFVVNQQVGVGLVMAAPDASAQLVQLREAEFVRAVHDNGVRIRYVNAGFNDGGAQQNIRTAVVKVTHHAFQIAFVHLSVRNHNACFGNQLGEHLAAIFDGGDFVVQEVHLTAAFEFAQDGFADDGFFFTTHEGFDRQPFLRRGGNDRQVTHAFHRHTHGARNRRCSQGEDVHFGAQVFHRFFLAHTKAVFFINNHQTQTVEFYVR